MTTKKNEERLFDLRTVDFHIAHGMAKQSEYDKYLKSLPDDEGNHDTVTIEDDLPETLTWVEDEEEEENPLNFGSE